MFKTIKRVVSKIKSLVLRVPDQKLLSKCFDNEYPTLENPIKRFNVDCIEGDTLKSAPYNPRISMFELDLLITRQEELAKNTVEFVKSLKVQGGPLEEYCRKSNKERPKFKCKGAKNATGEKVLNEAAKYQEGQKQLDDVIEMSEHVSKRRENPIHGTENGRKYVAAKGSRLDLEDLNDPVDTATESGPIEERPSFKSKK